MKKFQSLAQVRAEISAGNLTCVDLVRYYLQRTEEKKHLNALLEVYADEALQHAAQVDEKLKSGTAGKLAGMVMVLKDNICFKGHKVSASSKILEGFTSLYSSTVTERLLAEDCIILGRANCDEFAMGASNENSAYGPVLNDLDNTRVSGGSSGGSAVAVQADMCLAALGSDTGGSVRQPAAFTGLYGYKPTYGMVSRWGLLAYASSLDQISPITSSVSDMQAIMDVIAGPDEFDATLTQQPAPAFMLPADTGKKRIAYISQTLSSDGVSTDIKNGTLALIEKLKQEGHTVEAVDFPLIDQMVPCYYVLTTAEASSNLSRYQGLQYGYRSPNATDLESTFKKSRSEGFGKEVQRRIMLGTFVLSAGYYDAYYTKAQKVRRIVQQKTNEILSKYDFILSPTTPTPAFKIGDKAADPVAMYLADIFTVQAPLAGIPAISVPAGTDAAGMPWGIQLMSAKNSDAQLLAFAAAIN
ncbi:Asp-tRNA(Asn)/Glu-tRNA(Gln) amidotransferase subunit GatA [Oscillatoria amoena NRMC-F 0135]|nr:Asp-tRNA(Asn)/Glu-tRNA(Gln) amidotransferase subunit GatA [Oscillatoria amoena NRMC-F 0135]